MPENIIGARIRVLRKQRGLTQEQLAARCGVHGWDISRGTLAKIEAGIRCLSDKEIWALATALNVKVDELFAAHPSSRKR